MSVNATTKALGTPDLCCAIIDFLPRKDQNCCKRVCHAFQHCAETVQEERASIAQKVLRNRYLCHAVLSFVSIRDQESCKQVSRTWKENTNASQRQRILKGMNTEWIEILGQERLQNVPIRNCSDQTWIGNAKLPASFVIGFFGENRTYAAVRIKIYIPGRCCSRLNLKVHGFVKTHGITRNYIAYNHGANNFWTSRPVQIGQMLRGEELYVEVPETPSRCCSLRRVVSCFKRLFFESDHGVYHANIKLD